MVALDQGCNEFINSLVKKENALDVMNLSDKAYDEAYNKAKAEAYKEGFIAAHDAGYKESENIFNRDCKFEFTYIKLPKYLGAYNKTPFIAMEKGINIAIDCYVKERFALEKKYIYDDEEGEEDYSKAKKEAWMVGLEKARTAGYSKSEALFNEKCDTKWKKVMQREATDNAEMKAEGKKAAAKAVAALYMPGGMLAHIKLVNTVSTAASTTASTAASTAASTVASTAASTTASTSTSTSTSL